MRTGRGIWASFDFFCAIIGKEVFFRHSKSSNFVAGSHTAAVRLIFISKFHAKKHENYHNSDASQFNLIFVNSPSAETDTRLVGYALTGSPIPIILLVVAYVYYVTVWGPKWMEKRPAFDLQGVIQIYNGIQICTNLFIGVYVSSTSTIALFANIFCCQFFSGEFAVFHYCRLHMYAMHTVMRSQTSRQT